MTVDDLARVLRRERQSTGERADLSAPLAVLPGSVGDPGGVPKVVEERLAGRIDRASSLAAASER